ncbi:MAG: MBL fold metallo-hydrolase, partial [Deltaproteobacteria bacterium]|nr:MBL fold metallo-hydrolase [Deltaproteobacteria bacterium]
MIRFSVLASGSRGNACWVETNQTGLLIDAGLSCSECMKRLKAVGADPERLDGIVITHEHMDHIRGAGILAKRLQVPVYVNSATLRKGSAVLGDIARPVIIRTGQSLTVKDLLVETFTKCHDAADPMGILMSCEGVRLGLITDLGRSTPVVETRLKGCNALIVEFNHDERMLEEGPYPLEIKRRIRGPDGHLSNGQAKALLAALSHQDLAAVVLAHLSEKNNLPEKALSMSISALGGTKAKVTVSTQAA